MIDLTKLTPAPFEVVPIDGKSIEAAFTGTQALVVQTVDHEDGKHVAFFFSDSPTDAAFFAMTRNAFAGDPEALAWWEANRNRMANVSKKEDA